jgi:hypothetical protein
MGNGSGERNETQGAEERLLTDTLDPPPPSCTGRNPRSQGQGQEHHLPSQEEPPVLRDLCQVELQLREAFLVAGEGTSIDLCVCYLLFYLPG